MQIHSGPAIVYLSPNFDVNILSHRSFSVEFGIIGYYKGGDVTSAGWQVTLCDPVWHVSSRSSEACCELLYPVTLVYLLIWVDFSMRLAKTLTYPVIC